MIINYINFNEYDTLDVNEFIVEYKFISFIKSDTYLYDKDKNVDVKLPLNIEKYVTKLIIDNSLKHIDKDIFLKLFYIETVKYPTMKELYTYYKMGLPYVYQYLSNPLIKIQPNSTYSIINEMLKKKLNHTIINYLDNLFEKLKK